MVWKISQGPRRRIRSSATLFLHGGNVYRIHRTGCSSDGFSMGWYHNVVKFPFYPPEEVATDVTYDGIEEALLVELERRCKNQAVRAEPQSARARFPSGGRGKAW